MNENKIKEQFHYFNIKGDIDSVYGDWAVSTDGNIINSVFPFAILSIHFSDENWIEKIKAKVWYKQESEDDFLKAFHRAKEIIT